MADHWGSQSERYTLSVIGPGANITHSARVFGKVAHKNFKIRRGRAYSVVVSHIDSKLDEPDYDYTAWITAVAGQPAAFFTEDPDGILGVHDESDPFYAQGKSATLVVPRFTLDVNPVPAFGISALTEWSGQDTETIWALLSVEVLPDTPAAVDWAKSNMVPLITNITGEASYTPDGQGTIERLESRDAGNVLAWRYTAFKEPKSAKAPQTKDVHIAPAIGGTPSGKAENVRVRAVFDWLTSGLHKHGPDGEVEDGTTEEDFNQAWKYAKWKYDIDTRKLSSIAYSASSSSARGQTDGFNKCLLFRNAFSSSENLCASTLGHENVHGSQPWLQRAWWLENLRGPLNPEVPAYQWEIDNASKTGLSEAEIEVVTRFRNYYNGTSEEMPQW